MYAALTTILLFCFPAKALEFKESARLTSSTLTLDGASQPNPAACGIASDKKSATIDLKGLPELRLKLECEPQEIGSATHIAVLDQDKEVFKLKHAVSSNGDDGYVSEKQTWVADLNEDKHLDIVSRYKMKDIDHATGKAKRLEDVLSVYKWEPSSKTFIKVEVTKKDEANFRKKFDFKF